MEPLKNKVVLPVVALALLALPAAASGESVVPPENSAATQYTEAIPTGGGQKDAGKAGHGEKRSPSTVLGSHKAHKLNAQGPQGRAAAEVAAATAPAPAPQSVATAPAPAPEPQNGEVKSGHGKADSAGVPNARPTPHHASSPPPELTTPSGSSGVGEVLARATGSSSDGELGLLLPLLIVGTIVWAVFYLRRQRRPAA
jgi:hypothetical protein